MGCCLFLIFAALLSIAPAAAAASDNQPLIIAHRGPAANGPNILWQPMSGRSTKVRSISKPIWW